MISSLFDVVVDEVEGCVRLCSFPHFSSHFMQAMQGTFL